MSGEWVVVIAQKSFEVAKSRLELPPDARRAVVRAMFADTVRAVRGASRVCSVLLVMDSVDDAPTWGPRVSVLAVKRTGLNEVLRTAAEVARDAWPGRHLAAMPGDLPGLRSAELDSALLFASRWPRTFVADRFGEGTTMLTARSDRELEPHFGIGSRRAHMESGAQENTDRQIASVRHDVDNLADLAAISAPSSLVRPGPHLRMAMVALPPQLKEEIA